jgi:hypothetical protein
MCGAAKSAVAGWEWMGLLFAALSLVRSNCRNCKWSHSSSDTFMQSPCSSNADDVYFQMDSVSRQSTLCSVSQMSYYTCCHDMKLLYMYYVCEIAWPQSLGTMKHILNDFDFFAIVFHLNCASADEN